MGLTLSLAQLLKESSANTMRMLNSVKGTATKQQLHNVTAACENLKKAKEACKKLIGPVESDLKEDVYDDFLDCGGYASHVVRAWMSLDPSKWKEFAELACKFANVTPPRP